MQASPLQQNNAENLNEILETGLKLVPSELMSIIPESVWITLTLDQKKEILRQHNLLEKYQLPETPVQEQIATTEIPISPGPKNEIIVEQEQKPERNPDFEKAISELDSVRNNQETTVAVETEPVISAEELQRVEEEQLKAASTGKYTFFGYQPSQNTFANAKQISDDSPVSDSKTWAATLISKIFSLFQ